MSPKLGNTKHLMKTKIILFAMLVMMTACNTEPPVRNCTGTIVATLGCYEDESNKKDQSTYHEGYVILTSNNDTLLSFNVNVKDSIHRGYGILRIYPYYEIPYRFSYRVINPNDKRYIHFDSPCQDTFRPGFTKPPREIKQAIITPRK